MPEFMPKLPLAHTALVLPAIFLAAALVLAGIFLAAAPVLSGVLGVVPALARCRPQRFAKRAGFTLACLTRRSSGSASPPTELQR